MHLRFNITIRKTANLSVHRLIAYISKFVIFNLDNAWFAYHPRSSFSGKMEKYCHVTFTNYFCLLLASVPNGGFQIDWLKSIYRNDTTWELWVLGRIKCHFLRCQCLDKVVGLAGWRWEIRLEGIGIFLNVLFLSYFQKGLYFTVKPT